MGSCIIVGGGIAGLFASILASEKFDSVTLIESSEKCGGLLKSWKNRQQISFDFGTHILSETANDEMNAILFKGIYEHPELWNSFDVTKVSNSFSGKIYDEAQFIALHHLTEVDYKLALSELLLAPGRSLDEAKNLYEYAIDNYGPIITNKIFRPLFQKMQQAELEELHPNVHIIFAFNRFILGDATLSKALKKIDKFDSKLAFSSYYDGLSGAKKFYPKERGIELWIEHLCEQAKAKGVEIRLNTQVAKINSDNNHVTQVVLSNGEELNCSQLIWTIPAIFAIRAAGVDYNSSVKPEFCPMSLHHLVFDSPFLDQNYYSNINEYDCDGFRVTLYPNILEKKQSNLHHCTVEVLHSELSGDALSAKLADELKALGYVEKNAQLVQSDEIRVPMGFPKFTNEFVNEKVRQVDLLNDSFKNMTLLGKASKTEFFVYGILQETFDAIKKLAHYE